MTCVNGVSQDDNIISVCFFGRLLRRSARVHVMKGCLS